MRRVSGHWERVPEFHPWRRVGIVIGILFVLMLSASVCAKTSASALGHPPGPVSDGVIGYQMGGVSGVSGVMLRGGIGVPAGTLTL